MRRCAMVILALLWVLCLPAIGPAEGLLTIGNIGSLNLASVQIESSLKVGYQHMTQNINLPIPSSGLIPFALFSSSGLDFTLKDANVWVGGIRIEARRGSCSLFVNAEGSESKSVDVSTPSDPFWAGIYPVEWKGSDLEWWSIGGGGSFDICKDAAVVAGFKAELLSLRLADPVDSVGLIPSWQTQYGDRYSGDLRTKLWVPYFGLRLDTLNAKATLLFSPYTWADVRIPFRYLYVIFPGIAYGYEDARYTFKRGGVLFEGEFDYMVQAPANFGCTLWVKGNWCQIRGRGTEDYRADQSIFGIIVGSITESQAASGTFTSSRIAGGISFTYAF